MAGLVGVVIGAPCGKEVVLVSSYWFVFWESRYWHVALACGCSSTIGIGIGIGVGFGSHVLQSNIQTCGYW